MSELDAVAVDVDPAAAAETHIVLLLAGAGLAVPRPADIRRQLEDLAAECRDAEIPAGELTTPP